MIERGPNPADLDKESMPTDQLERFMGYWEGRILHSQENIVDAHHHIAEINRIIFERTGKFPTSMRNRKETDVESTPDVLA